MIGLVSMNIFPDEMTSLSTGLDSKEMEKPWFLSWTKVEKLWLVMVKAFDAFATGRCTLPKGSQQQEDQPL